MGCCNDILNDNIKSVMDIYCKEFANYLEQVVPEFIEAKKMSDRFTGVSICYILLGEDGKMIDISDYKYGGSYVEFANRSPVFVKKYEGSEKWASDMFNEWISIKRDEKIDIICGNDF